MITRFQVFFLFFQYLIPTVESCPPQFLHLWPYVPLTIIVDSRCSNLTFYSPTPSFFSSNSKSFHSHHLFSVWKTPSTEHHFWLSVQVTCRAISTWFQSPDQPTIWPVYLNFSSKFIISLEVLRKSPLF